MGRVRTTVALLLLVSGVAGAAPRIAALPPQVQPTAAPELRALFANAATRGLKGTGREILPATEVRAQLPGDLQDCDGNPVCAARAASVLHADYLVASHISVEGKEYSIQARLLGPDGHELAHAEGPCDVCTQKEAEGALERTVAKVASTLPEPPPPVATIKPAPVTPVAHAPAVAPPAAAPIPVAATPRPRTFPWRPVAIASLAAGVVGLAIGIPLLAIDGQPTCDKPDPVHSCKDLYDTASGGAVLTALGAGGLAASGLLFYFDHRARHRAPSPQVGFAPTVGGALMVASGRF